MFTMAILGNATYALGVMLMMEKPYEYFIIDHLPWLLGSIGTLIFDIIIFFQFLAYGRAERLLDAEKQPLLDEAAKLPPPLTTAETTPPPSPDMQRADTLPVTAVSPARPIEGKPGAGVDSSGVAAASPNMLPYDARSIQV